MVWAFSIPYSRTQPAISQTVVVESSEQLNDCTVLPSLRSSIMFCLILRGCHFSSVFGECYCAADFSFQSIPGLPCCSCPGCCSCHCSAVAERVLSAFHPILLTDILPLLINFFSFRCVRVAELSDVMLGNNAGLWAEILALILSVKFGCFMQRMEELSTPPAEGFRAHCSGSWWLLLSLVFP